MKVGEDLLDAFTTCWIRAPTGIYDLEHVSRLDK